MRQVPLVLGSELDPITPLQGAENVILKQGPFPLPRQEADSPGAHHNLMNGRNVRSRGGALDGIYGAQWRNRFCLLQFRGLVGFGVTTDALNEYPSPTPGCAGNEKPVLDIDSLRSTTLEYFSQITEV